MATAGLQDLFAPLEVEQKVSSDMPADGIEIAIEDSEVSDVSVKGRKVNFAEDEDEPSNGARSSDGPAGDVAGKTYAIDIGDDDGDVPEDQGTVYRKRNKAVSGIGTDMFDTFEAAPATIMYRAASDVRPTMEHLLKGEGVHVQKVDELNKHITAEESVKKNLFGTFEGVFARCLLNIWGVLMFLRLGWIVGLAGVWWSSLIVLVCMTVTVVTTTSLSAVCTNGEVKSGGAYFMISRALGPEFGGAIGILFSIANAGAVALHLVGFAETVVARFEDDPMTPNGTWDLRIVAMCTLCFLIVIAFVGVHWVVKFQLCLLFLLVASLISYLVGTFLDPQPKFGYTGYRTATFNENQKTNWQGETFFSLFGIFFPASTGIMAGANISGDLKNPGVAIPVGTMAAVFVSGIVYFCLIFMLGATLEKETPTQDNGLIHNFEIMIDTAWVGSLIIAGVFAAGLSSALAALVGAPRVFQAVCKDNLFPAMEKFGHGIGPNEEPVRAYVLTFLIAVGFILIGDLNAIAPFITNFFLISYALINYACYAGAVGNAPGWRPSYKYYNKWTSLAGCVSCVAVMFLINYITAFCTFAASAVLYKYVEKNPPDVNWGSAQQARLHKDALRYTVRLESTKSHVKTFRPSFLVLCKTPSENLNLIRFCSDMAWKADGALNVGNVILGSLHDAKTTARWLQARDNTILLDNNIPGFVDPVVAPDLRAGYQLLIQTSGVGNLRPNTVALEWPENWLENSEEVSAHYVNTIRDILRFRFSVSILRGVPRPIPEGQKFRTGRIDVYWLADDGGLTMLIPYLLQQAPGWAGCRMRVMTPGSNADLQANTKLLKLLNRFRIDADAEVIDGLQEEPQSHKDWAKFGMDASHWTKRTKRLVRLGEIMRERSSDAELICVSLPIPRLQVHPHKYMAWLDVSTNVPDVPVLFVRGTEQVLSLYS